MEQLIESFLIYGTVIAIVLVVIIVYFRNTSRKSVETQKKIDKAKISGLYEPISLHPVVSSEMCIGSGACITACPEKDILGILSGKAVTINASRCVGHGACFHACPVQAISLCIGTEIRGVDLPHLSQEFETNVPMMFVAGELGGMGLIKNAIEQGKQAAETIYKKINKNITAQYDIIIVGAGPAGIGAALTAKKNGLKFLMLEQDTLGGTINHFPRAKIVMTSPVDMPLFGKVKLSDTSKPELLSLWTNVLSKNNIVINEQEKVLDINKDGDIFNVHTSKSSYNSKSVVLAIGRRGTPRKLNVPGEEKEKVYYRLLEPDLITENKILIVGGGDSAVESAMILVDEGKEVTVSYRGGTFSRLKSANAERVKSYFESQKLNIIFNSNVIEIKDSEIVIEQSGKNLIIPNELVYVFAGGEVPTQFLEKVGISITKKFGQAILSHS